MSSAEEQGVSLESGETPAVGFEINGERYDIPTLDTLDLDEERILFLFADCVVQDFVPAHPSWSDEEREAHELLLLGRVRNPSLKGALAYIAYRRKHPEVTPEEGMALVGKVRALELDIAMITAGGDDNPPTSSQNEPEPSNGHMQPSSPTGSGSHIDASLGEAAWTLASTGTTA